MSRLSKWHAELKRLQEYHESVCSGISTFVNVPSILHNHPCVPECGNCILHKDTFDNWLEETFK